MAKRGRVIFVNRVYVPDTMATARYLGELTAALAEEFEVRVICSRTGGDGPAADPRVGVIGIPLARRPDSGLLARAFSDLFFLVAAFVVLLLRTGRHDVVVHKTDPPLLGVVTAAVSFVRGFRLIGWHQDVYPEIAARLGVINPRGPAFRTLAALRNRAARRAVTNVVIGEDMARELGRHGPVRVIRNWALEEAELLAVQHSALRDELGLRDRFVVAHCGTLGRLHPYQPLLEMGERYKDSERVHFLIAGGGHHYGQLRAEVERRAYPNWQFLPYQPQSRLADLLAAADVHLVLLRPDCTPLAVPSKLSGILAAGRPCLFIGDPAAELATLVERAGAGLVLPIDGAVTQWPDAAAGVAARQLYRERFSKKAQVDAWADLLREVAAR